jgi:hypothetical protein
MSTRTDAILSALAALLVLFSAMLDPRLSAALAVAMLLAFAALKLVEERRARRQ